MASTAASELTARARDSSAAESNNNGRSAYEQLRQRNIDRNNARLHDLGLLNPNGTSASTALLAPPNNAPTARKSKRQAKKNGADEPPAGVTSGTGAEADPNSIASRLKNQTRKRAGAGSFTQLLDGTAGDDRELIETPMDRGDDGGWSEGGVSGGGPKKAGNGGNSRRGRWPEKAGNGVKTVAAAKGPRTRSKAANPKGERIQSGKSGLRTFSKDGHAAMKASGRNSVSSGGGLHEHNRRNGKVLWERLQDLLNDLSDCRNGKMFGRMKGAAGKKGNFWCKGEDWNDFAALLKVLGNGGNKPGSVLRLKLTHDTQSTWGGAGPPFREPKEQKKMMPHSKAFKKATLVFCRTTNVSPSLM